MRVPFLRPFPGNEAHKLFSEGPKWGVLGGGQKVYVEKVYVLFRSGTSLNGEVRPFSLSDSSIWRFPSVSSLNDYSISVEVLKAILALRS